MYLFIYLDSITKDCTRKRLRAQSSTSGELSYLTSIQEEIKHEKKKDLYNKELRILIVFICILFFGYLDIYAESGGSISVNSICGRGCITNSAKPDVYLLNDTEWTFPDYVELCIVGAMPRSGLCGVCVVDPLRAGR